MRSTVLTCGISLLSCFWTISAQADPSERSGQLIIIPSHGTRPNIENIESDACFPIDEIRIKGNSLLDEKLLRQKVGPLAYNCLGNVSARAIVGAINEIHAENGYVTTQGYLPNQDIRQTKRLDINIVAGRVDKIFYQENTRDGNRSFLERISSNWEATRNAPGPWGVIKSFSTLLDVIDHPLDNFQLLSSEEWPTSKLWGATDLASEDVINLDKLQEGIDVFNEIPSNHVSAKLEPGDKPATSHIRIINKRSDSFRLTAGYDLNGASLNGTGQTIDSRVRFNLEKDNLIGVNDSWRTIFATGLNSNEIKTNMTVPWRRFKFSLTGEYTESATLVRPAVEYHYRSGEVKGKVSYLLERKRNRNTKLEAGLNWRTVERYINSAHLQPQVITAPRIGFIRTHHIAPEAGSKSFLLKREITYGAGIAKGLQLFGATRDAENISPTAPHAQFWKLDGRASLRQALRNTGILNIELMGQWSRTPLYAGDQMSLGALTTVRGFNNLRTKVDRGAVLRTEFAPIIPVNKIIETKDKDSLLLLHDMLKALQPYAFIDVGHGRQVAQRKDLTLVGAGGGLRFNHGRINVDLSFAHRIIERGTQRTQRSPEAYLSVNAKLF